jgi:hypothetical protein
MISETLLKNRDAKAAFASRIVPEGSMMNTGSGNSLKNPKSLFSNDIRFSNKGSVK